ncbi:hypothetical protein CIHG_04535 [Coccidioides immitis H538.4]|uniref:Uncharacterized protein n=1 Tax=Coccidioides immitis H538.4 TaxID=396776 RepID=A0A0J8RQ45_COCIT|nr:hypothetical protein CIHG_04535 [Coccidioides immitis H538.4]
MNAMRSSHRIPPEQLQQKKPSQIKFIRAAQMSLFANISSWPPLGQVTFLKRNGNDISGDKARFTILLEASSSFPEQGWEVSIWHNVYGDWEELTLQKVTGQKVPVASGRKTGGDYHRHTFSGELGFPKEGKYASFTVKYRIGPDTEWQWVKELFGTKDGEIVFEPPQTWIDKYRDGHPTDQLNNFIETFNTELDVQRRASETQESKRIMRPEARHIISKLDDLFLNLYHARRAYLTATDMAQSGDETGDENTKGTPTPLYEGRKRKRTASHPNSSHADGDGSGPSPTPPKSRKRLKRSDPRKIRLGLRDWSDVLGIASLAGWPNPAVMRTARRCADLFGQDMLFQTLEEGKVELEQDKDGSASWKYVEDSKENDAAMVDDDTPVPKYIDRPKEHAVFCPVEECKRHKQGFSRTWNLNQHLKTKHPTLVAVEERGKTD